MATVGIGRNDDQLRNAHLRLAHLRCPISRARQVIARPVSRTGAAPSA
jgi:hypothetical protein